MRSAAAASRRTQNASGNLAEVMGDFAVEQMEGDCPAEQEPQTAEGPLTGEVSWHEMNKAMRS